MNDQGIPGGYFPNSDTPANREIELSVELYLHSGWQQQAIDHLQLDSQTPSVLSSAASKL
jgi:hypothetical protein